MREEVREFYETSIDFLVSFLLAKAEKNLNQLQGELSAHDKDRISEALSCLKALRECVPMAIGHRPTNSEKLEDDRRFHPSRKNQPDPGF